MTKEAKLQAAVRILPEWVGYDEEIKALQQKIENANRQMEKEENGILVDDDTSFTATILFKLHEYLIFFYFCAF